MNISLIPNVNKDSSLDLTNRVVAELSGHECNIFLPDSLKGKISGNSLSFVPEDNLYSLSKIAVVIGGDGTILHTAQKAAPHGVAILGINMGTIGFIAELDPCEIYLLSRLFTGEYQIEERMMLDVSVAGKEFVCLNEGVVSNGALSKITEVWLYENESLISKYKADGVIISTPTGSTAYSLSAGGPIIHPGVDCMLAIPVSPHSLHCRLPFVFSAKTVLKLRNMDAASDNTYLTIDGRENIKLEYGDAVEFKKSSLTTKLVRIKDTHFFNHLYEKMSERV